MSTRTNAADTPSTDQPGQGASPSTAGRPRHHRHDLRLVLGPDRAKLNKLDGVRASVNLATEKRHRALRRRRSPQDLVTAVERPATARRSWAATPRAPAPAAHERPRPARETGPCASARWSRWRSPCRCCCSPWSRRSATRSAAPPLARARARHPGRGLGRVAVPPRRRDERPARGLDHGHAGVARGARRLRLVPRDDPRRRLRRTSTSRSPPSSRPSCSSAAGGVPRPARPVAPR